MDVCVVLGVVVVCVGYVVCCVVGGVVMLMLVG